MKRKRRIGIVFAVIVCYIAMVCLPYLKQGGVTHKTEADFEQSDFYSDHAGKDRAVILFRNEEALTERLRLISQASERIVLSTFDFHADNSGTKMLAALHDAAKRGVEIQILIDGYSYLMNTQGEINFQALGTMDTVTIKVYNPVNLLKPTKLMARLHDKYLLVDDTAYILGGRNTYDYFLGEETNYKNYDWDVMVTCEEADEASSLLQVEDYFQSVWKLPDCKVVMNDMPASKRGKEKIEGARAELDSLYQDMQTTHQDWFEPVDYTQMTVETNQIRLLSNPIEAKVKEPVLFYNLTELLGQAEGGILFHTPYILCNDYMMERLTALCTANGNVTMMTNSVANNGNPFGAMDYEIHKPKILDTGLQILEYDQGVSYHGKCFTAGDRLTGVGSFNWDMRSAYLDTELMLVIDSVPLTAMMREYMETYENDALVVKDASTYDLADGQVPQEISKKRETRIRLLKPFDWLLRYLL